MRHAVVIFLGIILGLSKGQLQFTEVPRNTTVEVGDSFTLNCSAEFNGSSADIQYSWLKDGEKLQETITPLQIDSAMDEDAGTYVCVAEYKGRNITSVEAVVNVNDDKRILIIAVTTSVSGLVLLLLGIVCTVWLYLCLQKSHIWDKAPLQQAQGEEGQSQLPLKRRSKSLTRLVGSNITSPPEQGLSISLENLLYGKKDEKEFENEEESFDPLNLDESMFEPETGSDQWLNIPKLKTKKKLLRTNKGFGSSGHYGIDPSKEHGTTIWPLRVNQSFPKSLSHQGDRRASDVSEGQQSDVSSEFSVAKSQNSSTFKSVKSVRFEVDLDDEGLDSGHVTGNSTPYDQGRRSSEPEFRQIMHSKRRSSAPECKSHSGRNGKALLATVEGEAYIEDEDVDEDNRITPSATSLDSNYQKTKEAGSAVSFAPHEAELHSDPDGDESERASAMRSISTSTRSIQTVSTLLEAQTGLESDEEVEDLSTAGSKGSPQTLSTKVPIAELILTVEQWKDLSIATATDKNKDSRARQVPREKVTEIRQKFLPTRQATTSSEQVDNAQERRRSKQLSRRVSETTRQLFPEPPPKPQPADDEDASASTITSMTSEPHHLTIPQPQPNVDPMQQITGDPHPQRPQPNVDPPEQMNNDHHLSTIPQPQTNTKLPRQMTSDPYLSTTLQSQPNIDSTRQTAPEVEEKNTQHLAPDTHPQKRAKDTFTGEGSETSMNTDPSPPASPNPKYNPIPIPVFSTFGGSPWQPSYMRGQDVSIPFSSPEETEDEDDYDLDLFETGDNSSWGVSAQKERLDRETGQDILSLSGSFSSESGDMLSPLPLQPSGFASVSPMGRSMFGMSSPSRLVPSKPSLRVGLMQKLVANEARFDSLDEHRQPPSKRAKRLTVIPEEALEAAYSATDILKMCT